MKMIIYFVLGIKSFQYGYTYPFPTLGGGYRKQSSRGNKNLLILYIVGMELGLYQEKDSP